MPVPLHSPTYLHGERPTFIRQLLLLLRGRPSVAVCHEACAERRVRRLCPPAVACSAGCLFACHFACHTHCPSTSCPRSVLLCPVHFCFVCQLFHVHVHQDRRSGLAVCQGQQFVRASSLPAARTVPLAAATRACSGGPCTGPFVLTHLVLFPAESMILGHGLV